MRDCYGFVCMKELLISGDPVARDRPLRGRQIDGPPAYALMQPFLERVLDVSVPFNTCSRLGPEVARIVGTAEIQADQMVDLVGARRRILYTVCLENFPLHRFGNWKHLGCIPR